MLLRCLRRFVLCFPSRPQHCACHTTEVQGWVTPMGRGFSQVEGCFILLKFSLKKFDARNKVFSWCVLKEKLKFLVGILYIPEEVGRNRRRVIAPQLQMGSFSDSDKDISLGHWLGPGSSYSIKALSMNTAWKLPSYPPHPHPKTSTWNQTITALH